ncbi:hypothetical protein JQC72_08970 [Polycladomyces sp. WAk]|uniref:Uncharacterized protein n=1 Tax=Polycladomyces zharkentensis TaxID=2807616 RepID=A0ABS2WJC9_9BACL|nr:hypothetical protein [Polycladomyces sp. WAk]MBN2909658.1 hypothetical protein [Polycladomyces sp. WAk]
MNSLGRRGCAPNLLADEWSTDAVIRTAIDWVHRCCGVMFLSGQIPGIYYLFTSLIVVWVSLFIWRVRTMVR